MLRHRINCQHPDALKYNDMKRLIFAMFILGFCYSNLSAQVKTKVDTVFYLLDTAKTPVNDRMWEVGIELPFKQYVLKCPCLLYNSEIAFMYPIKDTGNIFDLDKLQKFKLIDLPRLIGKSKQFIENNFKGLVFFIIEPYKNKYIIHRVGLMQPIKPFKSIDIITVLPDTLKKN